MVTPTFYVMEVASLFKSIGVWLWAKGILAEPDMLKALLQKNGFHVTISILQCSFKIFVNLFAFLYVKGNPNEICDEISFPSFFRKRCQHLFVRFKMFSKKCIATPIFLCGFQKSLQRSKHVFHTVVAWHKNLCIL